VASHHVTDIEGNVMRKRDLCPECFLESSPDAPGESRRVAAVLRDARCVYCGGQPCMGGTDFLAIVTGAQKLKFMCMACSMEHNRYLQEHLQEDAPPVPPEEQVLLLRKLDEEADQHMKNWVSQRGLP
jgi:hypothetical protein